MESLARANICADFLSSRWKPFSDSQSWKRGLVAETPQSKSQAVLHVLVEHGRGLSVLRRGISPSPSSWFSACVVLLLQKYHFYLEHQNFFCKKYCSFSNFLILLWFVYWRTPDAELLAFVKDSFFEAKVYRICKITILWFLAFCFLSRVFMPTLINFSAIRTIISRKSINFAAEIVQLRWNQQGYQYIR